ncbi:hypothetical protein HYX00_05465 [Candidatus Woesearchaeota archaeon]|nr:hypothetical protein [Candidatus Woesearchaeota archaeon]
MKKSQIYSQIFIYILALVLTSIILIYGYNAIQNFNKRANQVCFLKFKNDLSNAIESITSDYGSVKKKDLQLCAGYREVCFVESFGQITSMESPVGTNDPIIKDSIKSNIGKNVFLVEKIAKESFYAGNISVDGDVLCIDAKNNKISLRLEGKGNHVRVSGWGSESRDSGTTTASSASGATASSTVATGMLSTGSAGMGGTGIFGG